MEGGFGSHAKPEHNDMGFLQEEQAAIFQEGNIREFIDAPERLLIRLLPQEPILPFFRHTCLPNSPNQVSSPNQTLASRASARGDLRTTHRLRRPPLLLLPFHG